MDFDRINTGTMRFECRRRQRAHRQLRVFRHRDSHYRPRTYRWRAASLPPGFPATRIDGECYWDRGLISNTPLQWVLDNAPRQDTLAFQVDLWSAGGELPRDLLGIELRAEGYPASRAARAVRLTISRRSSRLRRAPRPSRGASSQRTRCCKPIRRSSCSSIRPTREGLQHRASSYIGAKKYEASSEGLRVLPADDGGALGLRLQRRPSNIATPRGVAAARHAGWRRHFRLRLSFHKREEHDHEDRRSPREWLRDAAQQPGLSESTPTSSTTANLSSSTTGPIRRSFAPSCRSRWK